MLSSAARQIVDRLITAVMTLVNGIAPSVETPTLPEATARNLLFRLTGIATRLISISAFGIRTPANPKPPTQDPDEPASDPRPSRPAQPRAAARLPRRPGWLLPALPEIAPAIAADIRALLADPAIASLFDRAPSLHRTLRPLLRALGLDAAPFTPAPVPAAPPHPPTPIAEPPNAPPPSHTTKPPMSAPAPESARPNTPPFRAILITES